MNIANCPLCENTDIAPFHTDAHRNYLQCAVCDLVFVPPEFHLSAADEKTHYDFHQNSPDDPRYRAFLNRLVQPVLDIVPPHSAGLDFGCGPGPTASVMFEEAGHRMAIHDPFYSPNPSVLNRAFDFITASEVVEHLHAPGVVLRQLWGCLKPGGLLGIMTQPMPRADDFATWHYKIDPTHVCFFCASTWDWVAARLSAEHIRPRRDVTLLIKHGCRS